MFNVDRRIVPSERPPNPDILSLIMPEDIEEYTEISVMCEKAISKYETESGEKVDRNKLVTAFLVPNGLVLDEYKIEGTYFGGKLGTVAELMKIIRENVSEDIELRTGTHGQELWVNFEFSVICKKIT